MAKLDLSTIQQKFTDAEYEEHINEFEVNPDEVEQRFIAWNNLYDESLMKEYVTRVKSREKHSLKMCYYDWLRQMFIIFDYNRVHQTRLEDEINSLIS